MKGLKTVLLVRVYVTTCYYYVNLGLIKRGYFWCGSLTLPAKRKSCSRQSVTICLGAFADTEFNKIWFYSTTTNILKMGKESVPETSEKLHILMRLFARENFIKFGYHANFKLERKQGLNLNSEEDSLGLEYSAVLCGNQ